MIRITNFNVGQADCFLLHFEKENKYFNLLIDGAHLKDDIVSILDKKLDGKNIQGVVVTHLDGDHIAGILNIIKNKVNTIKDAFFIFNKYDENLISYAQAKELAEEISKNFKNNLLVKSYMKNFSEDLNQKINGSFKRDDILKVNLMSIGQRKKCIALDDEMINITVLGPSKTDVIRFMRNWHEEKKNACIINASSIVLLIEFEIYAILMSGDGNFIDIEKKLREIELERIDVIKAAHHGAKENNEKLGEIARDYNCKEILFTISGQADEKHPSMELIKKLKETNEQVKLSCSADIKNEDLKKYMEQKENILLEKK